MIEHRSEQDVSGTLYRAYTYTVQDRKVVGTPVPFEGTTEHCWSLSRISEAFADVPAGTRIYLQPVLTEANYGEHGGPVWGVTPIGGKNRFSPTRDAG
ncbi:hypothetical protein ACWCPQ_14495 [Nocardia sp. NPDC001965]